MAQSSGGAPDSILERANASLWTIPRLPTQTFIFSKFWGLQGSRSRCWQGWFLLRPFSSALRQPLPHCVLTGALRCACASQRSLPLIRTPVRWDQGSTLVASFNLLTSLKWTSLVAQRVNRLPTMWETWVQSLGREDLLEQAMAPHSSTLAWKIPWIEERCRLQSMESQRVRHD